MSGELQAPGEHAPGDQQQLATYVIMPLEHYHELFANVTNIEVSVQKILKSLPLPLPAKQGVPNVANPGGPIASGSMPVPVGDRMNHRTVTTSDINLIMPLQSVESLNSFEG